MDSKSKQFLDDPIGDLCALAAKLERYALDFSAPPSPLRPKSIRRASAHLQERGADVAQPAHSVWYRNFVLAPVNAMAAGGPTHLDISQMGTPSDLDGALEFLRIGVRVWRRLRRRERHPTTFGVVVPACHLTITAVDSGWVLCGEIDAASVSSLIAATSKIPPGRATVDIDGVSFMDSSGLRVLVEASVRAKHDGGSLVLLNPQNAIRRLITLSGLSGYLELSDRAT